MVSAEILVELMEQNAEAMRWVFHLNFKFLARQIYFKFDSFVRVLRRLVI